MRVKIRVTILSTFKTLPVLNNVFRKGSLKNASAIDSTVK